MRQIAKLLIGSSLLLLISGCSQKLIMVPSQCIIPSTDEPMIDTTVKPDILGESKRCVTNYQRTKEAYEILKKAVDVCR